MRCIVRQRSALRPTRRRPSSCISTHNEPPPLSCRRHKSTATPPSPSGPDKPLDAQFSQLGHIIKDDFANFKSHYSTPKHPIVLAHGLMGFDELKLARRFLPPVHYWRGIKEAYEASGIACITTSVPTTGSIQARAHALHHEIASKVSPGTPVNIVAHSMGGLDARHLISQILQDPEIQTPPFTVKSLTTIATPHRGSSAADIIFREIGTENLPGLYKLMARLKIDSGAFNQLTTSYVTNEFNPANPNDPSVRYFSYGASATPHVFSVFRLSHDLIEVLEGANDGLVSVASSKWGIVSDKENGYRGTLMGVTHLDLINWTNRIKRIAARMGLVRQEFNAVAFYLGVADMLANEGL